MKSTPISLNREKADDGARTRDHEVKSLALYRLSYIGALPLHSAAIQRRTRDKYWIFFALLTADSRRIKQNGAENPRTKSIHGMRNRDSADSSLWIDPYPHPSKASRTTGTSLNARLGVTHLIQMLHFWNCPVPSGYVGEGTAKNCNLQSIIL